jgi:hypothetical protein
MAQPRLQSDMRRKVETAGLWAYGFGADTVGGACRVMVPTGMDVLGAAAA